MLGSLITRSLALLVFVSATALSAQIQQQSNVNTLPATQTVAPSGQLPALDSLATRITGAHALLGPGDLINISVFDTPELTQQVRVSDNGRITLALIGELSVSGLTPDALRQLIAKALIDGHYVRDPQVSLFVAEYAGQVAYVLGEVNRPGAYPLLRAHRLQDLLAVAGGLSVRAGNAVTISRAGDTPATLHVDLGSQDEEQGNPEIVPGDRISVAQAGIVYVLGEVGRPGGFLIDRHNKVTVMQALALAEGIQASASIKKASLLRGPGDARQEIPINIKKILKLESPDPAVEAGDILYIYGSLTRGLGRSAIQAVLATASSAAIYVEAGR